jgi:hypothetical protein
VNLTGLVIILDLIVTEPAVILAVPTEVLYVVRKFGLVSMTGATTNCDALMLLIT